MIIDEAASRGEKDGLSISLGRRVGCIQHTAQLVTRGRTQERVGTASKCSPCLPLRTEKRRKPT